MLPLGLSAEMSAADAAIRKKIYEPGSTPSIISNEEKQDIMKIVKSFEESGLLTKGISETAKNEAKEQKVEFFSVLLWTLAASMLGTVLTGREVIRADEGTKFLMWPHPLTNFETQKYYQNGSKFNGVYSRNNLSKTKYG